MLDQLQFDPCKLFAEKMSFRNEVVIIQFFSLRFENIIEHQEL